MLAKHILVASALALSAAACGGSPCDDVQQIFCEKACDCPDGGCVVRLVSAGLQTYDTLEECLDLAGPQVCDSQTTSDDAEACAAALQGASSCGEQELPPACAGIASHGG
ncbi:MAG: hypothetical protein KC657_24320 [Myxococcales bacterium]|nr:hypothetical protein [Myxococcales bacterium]